MENKGQKLLAAENFVEKFAEVAAQLTEEYDCVMTCEEVESLARMFRVFGHSETADQIVADHAKHDEEGDEHFGR